MKENIQIDPNSSTSRIVRAIANINKKYIVGNSNSKEKQEWQQVIDKLLELLHKKKTVLPESTANNALTIINNTEIIEETIIDFSNLRKKSFLVTNVYPNLNIYFKPKKNIDANNYKVVKYETV